MSIIAQGKLLELFFFIISGVAAFYFLWSAKKGKPQSLRTMPQVEAISEAVDRAVEMGKPVYVCCGDMAYLSGLNAGMTIAGMNVIRYTARLCIRKGTRVIFPSPYMGECLPLIDGIFRECCVVEGRPEAYKREDVLYYGNTPWNFNIGVTGTMGREGAAAYINIGALSGGGSVTPAGTARELGGIVVAGTPRYAHQGTWAMMADYPLFCDDVFAAGAICSQDEEVKSSIVGGDIAKVLLALMVVVGTILALAGQPAVTWLTKL